MLFFGKKDKKRAVLIVDDEVSTRTMLGMLFEEKGWEVLEAGAGDQGVRLAVEKEPDLILLDINLPQMTGFEAITFLRANPKTQRIPIIMCTAMDSLDDVDRCLSAGANDFIQKPFDLMAVLAKVERVLKNIGQPPAG